MVRNTGEKFHDREKMIENLKVEGYHMNLDYVIIDVPNITNITYGRKVGYKIEQESFEKEIEDISGTRIRNANNLL